MATVRLARRAVLPTGFPRLSWGSAVALALLLLVAYQTVVPLAMLAWFSFSSAGPTEGAGTFTLQHYAEAYLTPSTYQLLGNTLIFAGGSTILGVTLGVLMAWVVERTNVPLRNFGYVIVPLTAAIPGSLYSISWVLLLNPRTGLFNLFFTQILGFSSPPLQPNSLPAMILVESIRVTPTVFLMVVGLFRSMDPSLEEAAATAKAGVFRTLRSVTLPLMAPGILAVCLYVATSTIGTFETPAFMGMPGNIYVFSTRIWLATSKLPRDYGLAASLSMLFAILAVLGIFLYHRTLRVQQRFATVTGKAFRPRVTNLGRWRYAGTAAIIFYFLFVIVAPAFILVWASLLPFYQVPSVQALKVVSLVSYERLFSLPWVFDALRNTGLVLLLVPTFSMGLSLLISWIVVRSKLPGRKLLDSLAFLPHTMPSIVLGLAFLWMYLTIDAIPIYNTIWIIVVALATSYLAFGTRTTNGAMYQLHRELEEAGTASGASWWTVLKSITAPLLLPTLVSGWIWIAMQAVRELSLSLMLVAPSSRIVSVLIWSLWDTGEVDTAAAAGVLLMVFIGLILGIGRLLMLRLSRQQRA
jgi:iron(III) transport system permease protein